MGTGVIFVRLHALAILIPLYTGSGSALCLAVKGGRLPLGDNQIRGILHNPRCAVFKPCPGPCEIEMRTDVIYPSDNLPFMKTYNPFVPRQTVANPFERKECVPLEMLVVCSIHLCVAKQQIMGNLSSKVDSEFRHHDLQ